MASEQLQALSITGIVNKFLFHDNESGFMIFILDTESSNDSSGITVKGTLPLIHIGQRVEITGQWVIDPKYGRQFAATLCKGSVPTTITGLEKFLGSGLIKGIGPVYAQKMVKHFDITVLDVIEKHPNRLKEISGLGPKRIEIITNAWKDHKEIAEIMVFLQDKGISTTLGVRLYKRYKHNTISLILQNPYRLAEEVWGVGFKTADEIAQKLGFSKESPHRISAGILYALVLANQQGHLYQSVIDLKKQTHELLELSNDEGNALKIKRELHNLYEQEKIKFVSKSDQHFIATTRCYKAEYGTASLIKNLIAYKSPYNSPLNIDLIYKKLELASNNFALNENQIKGILTALQNKVTIITGGPGTGKTTLVRKLIDVLEEQNINYKLAAPTGRAAKRMQESTRRTAATLHRLLEFDRLSGGFKHNENNALNLEFLVIDEASMLDIFLAYAVLKAVPLRAHVVFIGDIDQLPSVGAGNFLNDCISSQVIPCIRLTHVFRQAQDSLIIVNAHKTNKGEFPVSFMPDAKRDFIFIKENDIANIQKHIKTVYYATLPKYNIAQSEAIILSPMNRGGAGTYALNHYLQALLNPQSADQVTSSGIAYKLGDRVMQIKNNYDKFVFNGDIGFVESINQEDHIISVNFNDKIIEYDFSDLNELVLAYAITVHKSQGSEYPAVIIPIFMQHFTLLQRNLLYTAITRARNLCVLIGEPRAIGMALRNNKSVERVTFLHTFLRE